MVINNIFNISIVPLLISVNINVKFKNGTIESIGVVVIAIINAIIPGKNDINVKGVNALCASLNVFDVLAIEMHNPLIKKEYAIITTTANNILIGENIVSIPSYIENMFFVMIKEIIANTKLIIPVIIEDTVTPKNFPTMMSLLFIGNVNNVSKVPLSLSPAVVSVAGYVADTVIAIIIKRKA